MLNTQKHTTLFSLGLQPGIKPVFFIFLIFFQVFCLKAQENLVPNGSFEEYWECPTAPGSVGDNQLERCKYWNIPTSATSDYYNSCQFDENSGVSVPSNWFGNQLPFHGDAYIGLILFIPENPNSEYIQCKLTNSLKACGEYQFSMRVSLSDYSSLTTNKIGVRFDKTPITFTPPLEFIGLEIPAHIQIDTFITDTSEWVLFSGQYVAHGGEEYLTIGRFIDTNIYSNSNIPFTEVMCDSCFTGHPTAYYYIDSVKLVLINDLSQLDVPNVLTANADNVNDYWYPFNTCLSDWKCIIVNRWGEVVSTFYSTENGWDGKDSKGNELLEGVYFYRIEEKEYKQTGFIHLMR